MDFDLSGAYEVGAIEVDVAGRAYVIPPMTARDWLDTLTAPGSSWADIVPGLCADADDLDDTIVDGTVDPDELTAAARDALTVAAGVRWSIAARLVSLSQQPGLAGELILRGVNPARLTLCGYLVACYQLATRAMTDAKHREFDVLLTAPSTGADAEDWYDEEEAAEGFMAALTQGG